MGGSPKKLSWVSLDALRDEHFSHLLDTEAGKRVFDVSFMDKLRTRMIDVEKTMWKITIINWVLVGALFVNAFVLPTGINIAGLSAQDVGKVKELLLFVSATLTLLTAGMWMNLRLINGLGDTWMKKMYGSEIAEYGSTLFAPIVFDLPTLTPPARRYQYRSWVQKAIDIIVGVLLTLYVLAYSVATLSVYITILLDVVEKPSLPFHLSWFVIGYAGVVYVGQFLLHFSWPAPLPYHDYSLVVELTELRKSDPSEYKRRMSEMAKSSHKK